MFLPGARTDTDATSFSAIVNSIITGAAGIGVALRSTQRERSDKPEKLPAVLDNAVDIVST